MAKTAWEEAAAILCDDFIPARHYADDRRAWQEREALAKRLRAEGRKIKRYERLILAWWLSKKPCAWTADFYASSPNTNHEAAHESLCHEAARIQRASKK